MFNDVVLDFEGVARDLHDGLQEPHVSHVGVWWSFELDFIEVVVEDEEDDVKEIILETLRD